jgi:3-oxoacyl-[acyl-carrier protein] reductase
MDLGLRGKVALVAASSQGLGRAVAEELAIEGASLILCSRGAERLETVCESIREKTGTPVLAVPGDLSVYEDVNRIVQTGFDRFKQIDILVTNAGGPPAGTFDNLSRESWNDATRGLLTSVLDLTRLVLPGMRNGSGGGS